MKKLTKFTLLVSVIIALTLGLQHCNKNYEATNLSNSKTISSNDNNNSDAVLAHILAFKKKMEYYKENRGLKSTEKEQVDSTVLDWESTINLTYCYSYLELSDARVYDTVIALPPISKDSMLMTDISNKYYNEIVYAVQAQYFQAPFTDSVKKLMVVDLEKTTGGNSLQIKSFIGNTLQLMHPPYDWMYGEYLGTCDGQHDVGVCDAAHIIANNTRFHFKEDPPTGCRWYFYNVQTIFVNDPTQYPNPNDPDPANYEDYLIYYASSAVGTITHDVLCLEYNDELAFYKQNYIDLTQGWINNSNGRKFKDCNYLGYHFTEPNTGSDIYKHKLATYLGYRGIECGGGVIEDISQY